MAPPLKLLDDSSDEEQEAGFSINKNYAERYDIWRNKEELQKLKDLSKEISSTSSESEEEEEPEIEKEFLKTLSLLKSKDPRIYDKNTVFFKEEDVPKKPKVKKEKPMFMKDYERKIVLEQNGMFVDEEDEDNEHLSQKPLLTNREEEEIKKKFQEAVPDSDEEEDLFEVRTKTKAEEEKEDADYKQWLETEKDMLFLNKCWNDPNITEGEKFLRDYILNKKFLTDDKPGEIPMYDEITQDIDLLNEDEKELEKQEKFEHKYNFRFEEPDEEFIKTYPRTIGDSLRRENSKRKQKREEYTERKKKEKEQKREELKRLKALKRKEIEEKFIKLKEASGQDQLNLDESDIESDFDPDKHDQKMREMFNDDYYNVEEEQKPEFEFDEEIDNENWDRWTRDQMNHSQNTLDESEKESASEEDEEDSKNNLRSQFEQEMIDSTTSKKKRGRKKSLFAKILSQSKPLYDPSGKSFDEYLDEYYKLDYEDIIGDMPVRFKYRKVVPNDFGLTVDEILAAQDKELNRWCSVKKTCQYRDDKDEIYDVQAFKKKAENLETKKKILTSVYTPPEEEKIPLENTDKSNEVAAKPKRKKKRSKKKKNNPNSAAVDEDMDSVQTSGLSSDITGTNTCPESSAEVSNQSKSKKKKKKSLTNMQGENSRPDLCKNKNGLIEEEMQQEDYGQELNHEDPEAETNQNLVVRSKKKKKNKAKTLEDNDSILKSESYIESNESNVKNSTKRKRKKSESVEGNDSTVEPQSELEMSGNVSSKKKKRKLESLEKESSSSFTEYNENDNEAEARNSQNVVKKNKLESVAETDLPSVKQPKNRKSDSSFIQQSAKKSICAENAAENNSNRKKKKRKNNQQSFGSQPSQKQNFYSQKFQFNKKQNDSDSVQILDNSGKKIISSNTRLSAFEINPKKFKNRMIYGKNQT